ncbi:MAG: hypothetical protein IID42_11435 [Planctomycetes bacterium]|nr:hypothetical protein [Planctomycetota bacterium]
MDDKEMEPADIQWAQLETMDILQTAEHISGTLTLTPKEGVQGGVVSLTVKGDITDRFITMIMKSLIPDRLAYAVLLAEVVGDGHRIQGRVVYYDTNENAIATAKVVYQRQR